MAIDIDTTDSDGWWMQTLWEDLKAGQPRLNMLEAHRRGCPPLPRNLPKSLKAATREMIRMSQLTTGDLIVQAMIERMGVGAIRTAVSDDDNGDTVAMDAWTSANLPVIETDVYRSMTGMSRGYVAVALDRQQKPVATYEDPREMITYQDPVNPVITLRAFKLYHDRIAGRDYAILWRPGQKRVASRQVGKRTFKLGIDGTLRTNVSFLPGEFTMHPVAGTPEAAGFDDPNMLSEEYSAIDDVLITPFENREGVGEFELHLDHMNQINHVILQCIIIATFQAFKQRALEVPNDGLGDLPKIDDNGKTIDYDELFAADPGAIWRLPIGAKLWESGQVDMNGVLQMVKDAIQRLASVTRTPFSMFASDAVNQSAAGAQLSREGLVFKVGDRIKICTPRWARVASHVLLLAGEAERADPAKIKIGWLPVDRYSLAEMAAADAQALSLPDEQKWQRIWQMTPDEIAIAQAQKTAQQLRDAALGVAAAPVPPTPPAPVDELSAAA